MNSLIRTDRPVETGPSSRDADLPPVSTNPPARPVVIASATRSVPSWLNLAQSGTPSCRCWATPARPCRWCMRVLATEKCYVTTRPCSGQEPQLLAPFADVLPAGGLSPEAVDYLKTTFFKTELELGSLLAPSTRGPV